MSLFSWLGNNADWLGPAIGLGGALLSDSSGKNGPQTTNASTQKMTPWSGALPMINDAMANAKDVYNSGAGTNYYPGDTYTPMGWDTSTALNQIRDRAMAGSDLTNDAQSGLQDIINGTTNGASYDQFINGTAPANGVLGDIANSNANTSRYDNFYNGSEAPGNSFYNDIASGNNPYLDQMVNSTMDKVSDRVNSVFSKAGRYGSEAHQETLTENLGNVASDMMGSQYNSDMNRRMSAANALDSNFNTDQNRRFNAANAMSGLEQQNVGNKLNAAGMMNSQFNNEQTLGLSATNASNNYGSNALAQRLQAIGMAPNMAATDYTDAGKLLGVGEVVEGYQNKALQDDMQRWNFAENQPLNLANNYANLAMGFGGLGSTSNVNGNVTQPGNTWQQNAGNWLQFGQDIGGMFGGFKNNLNQPYPSVGGA